MRRPIGYYVHHHGDGHLHRALAIASAVEDRIVLLGTGLQGRTGHVPFIELPDDRWPTDGFSGEDGAENRPGSLHYAPLDHAGVRDRAAVLCDWIARERPALVVVDVSVEIAMLVRLAGTPTVYVRLAGLRNDRPHLDAFHAAEALLSPFAAELDDPGTPLWVREKTMYFSGLTASAANRRSSGDDILVILGSGGSTISDLQIVEAAQATPDRQWRVAGRFAEAGRSAATQRIPTNLTRLGWVDDIDREIARAGLIVGTAGDGVVSAVLASTRPYICVPEPRPYDEQRSKARQLACAGVASVCDQWPEPEAWPDLLVTASAPDPATAARLHDPQGVAKAGAFLRSLSGRWQ